MERVASARVASARSVVCAVLAFGAGAVFGAADRSRVGTDRRTERPPSPVVRVLLSDPDRRCTRGLSVVPSNPGDLSAQPSGTWVVSFVRESEVVETVTAREE